MQQKSARDEINNAHFGPWTPTRGLTPGGQRLEVLPTAHRSPRGVPGRLKAPSTALLAQLEAENTVLRNRAVELALHIQKLAERPR
jgi:hypothetical protein